MVDAGISNAVPWTTHRGCRVCGASFDPLLDLGAVVVSTFLDPATPDPPAVPLNLVICSRCDLVQLKDTVDPDLLFRTYGYWYQSGVNEVMAAELADVVAQASRVIGGFRTVDMVLDIGANDGTLLAAYTGAFSRQPFRVGVEPATEFTDRLTAKCDLTLTDYFPQATKGLLDAACRVITSVACFYNAPDPVACVAEIDRLLHPLGVWIVQMQDLGQMVVQTAYDNIVPEHLFTYSARTFAYLLRPFDLHITHVERRAINGGSLRFHVQRKAVGTPVPLMVWDLDADREALDRFAWRVGQHKAQLQGTIAHLRDFGCDIDLIGASTKGSTLLQHCWLDHSVIRRAVERTPEKVGKVTSGTRIPIVSEAEWRRDPAPHALLGIWPWRDAIIRREAGYLVGGGSIIVPLPRVEVVSAVRI